VEFALAKTELLSYLYPPAKAGFAAKVGGADE
jgi:hypothetical protein